MSNCWSGGLGACRVELHGDRQAAFRQFIVCGHHRGDFGSRREPRGGPDCRQSGRNPVRRQQLHAWEIPTRAQLQCRHRASVGDPSVVHDLLCPAATATGPCTSGAEAVARVVPTSANTPGANLTAQLNYLQANPSSAYTEVGPFSGVAGVFLQFTKEAGLHYDVSIVAVSSATLTGYLNNTGSEAGMLPLIANAKWNQVVMQDQSFRPLPSTITINGVSVPTRGSPCRVSVRRDRSGQCHRRRRLDGRQGKRDHHPRTDPATGLLWIYQQQSERADLRQQHGCAKRRQRGLCSVCWRRRPDRPDGIGSAQRLYQRGQHL